MSINKFLGAAYKLSTSENFDEYMKAIGVGAIMRKMGNVVTPTVTLTEKDGLYTFTTSSTFKTTVIVFKPDEEFEEETADGRKVKSVVHFEGPVMTHIQRGEKTTTITREFSDELLKVVMVVGDVKCTRVYEKIK
ncbi:UNVERIFIED_CONTAM: hypothetical protein PYX00_009403 [Menopon gallinae]|uniref:Fatty acid-binding protein, muscle n=1 Tax=Menopon gallinae TaxID=328185 RepID=A0AAW2HBS9_9NEOP